MMKKDEYKVCLNCGEILLNYKKNPIVRDTSTVEDKYRQTNIIGGKPIKLLI